MITPVSFEIAKLLKEKGLKIDANETIFYRDEVNNIEEHQIKNRDVLYNYTGFDDYVPDENEYQTYTIAEVVMWLYEKYGVWIDVSLNQFSKPKDLQWMYSIVFTKDCTYSHSPKSYNSPTEAYMSAIEQYSINVI